MSKIIARTYVQTVFNDGHIDQITNYVAENITDHDAPPGLPAGIEGQKFKIAGFRAAFTDLTIVYVFQVEEGDRVAGRFRLTGTHSGEFAGVPASGNPVDVIGHDFLKFENGKITDHWLCMDVTTLMAQIQS